MSGYVIHRMDQSRGFLCHPDKNGKIWSQDITRAKRFRTHDHANAECRGNEQAIALADVLQGFEAETRNG